MKVRVRVQDDTVIVQLPPIFIELPVARVRDTMGRDAELVALSPREHEVFGPLSRAKCNKDIATEIRMSLRMVKFHVSSIYRKLGCETRGEFLYKFGKRES